MTAPANDAVDTDITRMLSKLDSRSVLVSEAYYDRYLTISASNLTGINQLLTIGALIKFSDEKYYLAPTMRRHFDLSTGELRSRRIDIGFSERMNELQHLIDMHQIAWLEGNYEGAKERCNDIESMTCEIAISLDQATNQLETQVLSNFSHLRTIAEKKSQTAFYAKQSSKILDALETFKGDVFLEPMRDHVEIFDLLLNGLVNRIPIFLDRIRRVIRDLQAYSFTLRKFEEKTMRFQKVQTFLEANPGWEMRDITDDEHLPAWMTVAPAMTVGGSPVVEAKEYEATMIEIAAKLPRISGSKERELRGIGKIANLEQTVIAPVQKPEERVLKLFAMAAKAAAARTSKDIEAPFEGLSASAYHKTLNDESMPKLAAWIYIVLLKFQNDPSLKKYFSVKVVGSDEIAEGISAIRGNKRVTDVLVIPRKHVFAKARETKESKDKVSVESQVSLRVSAVAEEA